MSREKQIQLEEINRPRNEELFDGIEKQYQEIAKIKAESEQIEEMANDLRQAEFWDVDEDCCELELDRRKTAEALYNVGYRKQSEGEWIEHETEWGDIYYSCSACGDERCTIDGTIHEHDFYYCPNCGAKMKGGAE